MSHNLPALHIVLPLLAAPISALMPRIRWSWWVTLIATWSSFIISLLLLTQVITTGEEIRYTMGGWAPPFGIEYRVDVLSGFVLAVVSGMAAIMLPYARLSVEQEISHNKISLFYSAFLLCLAGLLGIVITNDAFNIYVFLEISSLATYTLIGMGRDKKALSSAFNYLILGTIGATFILIGIGLLYMMTGTLNIDGLAQHIANIDQAQPRPILAAFAFITVGIFLKIALFPLHMWLPNAYTYSPSFVAAFLAATATKVGIYLLLRFFFMLFGYEFSFETMPVAEMLMVLSALAIIIGSLNAIFQYKIRKVLAFSSLAQIGYIILGISMANLYGLTAGIVHIANHAVTKGALFLAMGAITYQLGNSTLIEFRGIGKRMPWTTLAFVIAGLSLIGVPLTAGFISKWYLVLALIEKQAWIMLAIVIIGSLLALIYIWRLVEIAYFYEPVEEGSHQEAPLSLLIPLWILVIITVFFGINTEYTIGFAEQAAKVLLGIVT